jgi:XTP/dITP diphosphohydrolase
LRTAVLEFIDTVRGAEKAIAADRRGENVPAELDVAPVGVIAEEEWRAHWLPAVEADEAAAESEEPDAETDTADGEVATGESAENDEGSSDDQSTATGPQ